MMLIAIVYLACAAFVLVQIGKAPRIDADGLPDEATSERHDEKRSGRTGDEPKGNEPPKPLPRAL
jgi:hypothetical protein